jgi:hypothetical protein
MIKSALPGLMFLLLDLLGMVTPGMAQDDYARNMEPMLVDGRITDGENKLQGTEVVLFQGNEVVVTTKTDKGGRFGFKLDINREYAMEFRHDGFVAKRIAIDTHMPKPKPGQEFELVPLDITISLLEKSRYDGAPTDDLDFPFAFIKFNKRTLTFEPDAEYTMGMQRTNGALLLMAARADKR